MREFEGPVLATSTTTYQTDARALVVHTVGMPASADRVAIWRSALSTPSGSGVLELAAGYALRPGLIVQAAAAAQASTGPGRPVSVESIHAGVRACLGSRLDGLATRVEWRQTWTDLVLPPDQLDQVVELVARVRRRAQVLDDWGFAAKVGKGHGVAALMSGPPGTGKTMVAGLIANELGLDLYQVDLSRIVSKYIGETEKQLSVLFDAAETGHAVLLFDEADSLFGKRSEVKSSNDRYANLEVNYLLQRMESFTGIALLTTNHETAIDEAFRRRLALHIRFPMPEPEQRAALWRAMLPEKAPVTLDLDPEALGAAFEMSGGYIKNAVLRAAYLVAEEATPIGMSHLRRGARAEYEAMGKVAFHG